MADGFGDGLKGLRGDRTQAAVAAAAGVPLTTLRNWEQGRRRPDLAAAYRLARALGVPLDQLGALADRHRATGGRGSGRATPATATASTRGRTRGTSAPG